VRVSSNLECESRKRFAVRRLTGQLRLFVVGLEAFDCRDVERRRQVINNGVKHGLNTLVLERRTGENRSDLVCKGRATNRCLDVFDGVSLIEELLCEVVISVCDNFEKCVVVFRSLVFQIGRDFLDVVLLALLGVFGPDQRAHADEIDNAAEVSFCTDRDLQHCRRCTKAGADGVDTHVEVGTGAVELVDEADTRHAVLVSLTPHGL